MADRKPSGLRQGLQLYTVLALAVLVMVWALHTALVSREADDKLEHGPGAKQEVQQNLQKYYDKKNKPAAD